MVTLGAFGGSMAAMSATMLPSAFPLLRLDFATARSLRHSAALLLGYAAVWAALGALTMELAMIGVPSRAAAGALAAAAVYQASPFARRCLTRCRTPLARIVVGWREGARGGIAMGVRDGLWCVGCCAGLVVALIALGAVSLWWMLGFGAFATIEKVAPFGFAAHGALAVVLAVGAIVVV